MKTLGTGTMLAVFLLALCLASSCNKPPPEPTVTTGTAGTSSTTAPTDVPDKPLDPGVQNAAASATAFSFRTAAGELQSSTQFLGKPLVVNFWADWCPPCVDELPDLQKSYDAHKGQFNMIAVAAPSSKDANGFWKQNGYSIPMVHDVDGGQTFKVEAIPTTLFIDANGSLIESHLGGMTHEQFEQKLAQLLH
jgi:thiol-disulfide isomerase/thioredoxin